MEENKFFENICKKEEFSDRKTIRNEESVDVIIPVFNTNPLFEKNLYSFYNEIPINRLIIGNGGSTDDSIEIINKFPRVLVVDQSNNRTLGYCIAELISLVETEWFVYLHDDVYLPENWYDNMKKHQNEYDWYECDRWNVVIIGFNVLNVKNRSRPFSGGQMGKKIAFKNIISKINDDYLYRNEDMIFQGLVEAQGYKYGRVLDTYIFHERMNKKGEKNPKFENVIIKRIPDKKLKIRTYNMQVRGIIKYLKPNKRYLVENVNRSIKILMDNNALNLKEFKKWVKLTNESWLKYIRIKDSVFSKFYKIIIKLLRRINSKFL